jgi:hypothetical protein
MSKSRFQDSQDASGPRANKVGTATESTATPIPQNAKSSGLISSFEIFNFCIERSKNLLKIHQAAHGKKAKPERYLADAHRAAIVLAISALDAFIRSFVIIRMRSILGDKTLTLPEALASKIKTFLKEDALLEAARKDDLLDRVEKAFRKDFERQSFQGTRQITESLKLIGFNDVFHDIAVSAGENEDTLRERLDRFTDRRHAIAHRGDFDLSQNPPIEQNITKKDSEECIRTVSVIAAHINKLGVKP